MCFARNLLRLWTGFPCKNANHLIVTIYREADQIHLIALSQAMHTGISVAYLDADISTTEATLHKFEVDSSSELYPNFDDIHLLYRPGMFIDCN